MVIVLDSIKSLVKRNDFPSTFIYNYKPYSRKKKLHIVVVYFPMKVSMKIF